MKRVFLVLICFQFVGQSFMHAQDESLAWSNDVPPPFTYKNIFFFTPFNMAASEFQMGYERLIGDKGNSFVFQTGITYGFIDAEFAVDPEIMYKIGIFRKYNKKKRGVDRYSGNFFDFYAAPFAKYQYMEANVSYYDPITGNFVVETQIPINAVIGGFVMGMRFVIAQRLIIDFYAGGGIKHSFEEVDMDYYSIMYQGYRGIVPKGNVQIGVTF